MSRNTMLRPLAALGLLLLPAAAAEAGFVGYSLTISNSSANGANVPEFSLTNDAASTETITGFQFTIGQTNRNFDSANVIGGSDPSIVSMLQSPDTLNGFARSDVIDYRFLNFSAGRTFAFNTDLDIDNQNSVENFRSVFFNNGAAPNSVITVDFSDGTRLVSDLLPDANGNLTSFTFSDSANLAAVPEPGSLSLFGLLALGGVAARSRKRRRVARVAGSE